jgi:hypothetical protein
LTLVQISHDVFQLLLCLELQESKSNMKLFMLKEAREAIDDGIPMSEELTTNRPIFNIAFADSQIQC